MFRNPYDLANEGPEAKYYEELLASFGDSDKAVALAAELDVDLSEIEEEWFMHTATYKYQEQEWRVLTDDEADDMWDENMEDYIDDVVIRDIPEPYQGYFDRESFKRDAAIDGRGQSLSPYDGNESEQEVNGTMYYLYRIN